MTKALIAILVLGSAAVVGIIFLSYLYVNSTASSELWKATKLVLPMIFVMGLFWPLILGDYDNVPNKLMRWLVITPVAIIYVRCTWLDLSKHWPELDTEVTVFAAVLVGLAAAAPTHQWLKPPT